MRFATNLAAIFLAVSMSSNAFALAPESRLDQPSSQVLVAQNTPANQPVAPGDAVEDSALSPKRLESLQNKEQQAKREDARTLKSMYGNVNFVETRSVDGYFVVSSGFEGEKNNFESLSGYSFGLTWEFPILMKSLEGGTPIFKARAGKTEINMTGNLDASSAGNSTVSQFIDALGVSEIYTVAVGGGYCYHVGFNCVYGMYNTYLTGQLSTVEDDGSISTVPTQLKGYSIGMSSTLDILLGVEMTMGMEYSMLEHVTPIFDAQKINTLSLNIGFGAVTQPRYVNMRPIEYVK